MSDIEQEQMMIGVDVGGTFTDVVAVRGGRITTVKVQTNATETELAVIAGAAEAGVADAVIFNHASTHGLNAVITRKLPKIAFLATEGHRDILDRGNVWRPVESLTDPHWRRSFGDAASPIVPRYLRRNIRERILADGHVLIPLDEAQVLEELEILRTCRVEGVAICLLNAYMYGDHERRVRELVRQVLGDIPCSISCEVSPLAKEYPRASTTVIDANMRIIYGDYTANLEAGLRAKGFSGDLNYANCAAQLLPAHAAARRPYEIIFSGPAAGTVAAAHFGELVGAGNLLCADVGGTSCDISLVTQGKPYVDTTFELEHDLIVNALSVEISSIGAGGGSLVSIDLGGAIQVGPGSAGSDPGPACYGKGGTRPTMTDTYLLMGIIDPTTFAGGRVALDIDLSERAFAALDSRLALDDRISHAFRTGLNNIAEGLSNVAVGHGVDLRDYSLLAFGAAGPMMLPAMLDLVQVAEVVVPPHPGLFSALGLVSSDQVYSDRRSAYIILDHAVAQRIDAIFAEMEAGLVRELGERDISLGFKRSFDGQLLGQSWETPFAPAPAGRIDADAIDRMIASFHETYKIRWGNAFPELPVQSVTLRVEVIVPAPKVAYPKIPLSDGTPPPASRTIPIRYLEKEPIDAGEYDRTLLRAGDIIAGPAVIREALSTTFVLPEQIVRVGAYGELHISKTARNGDQP